MRIVGDMDKPLAHKDIARFDALDAKVQDLTADEHVKHRDLAVRIARTHRTSDAVRAAARDIRRLAGEAWGNVEGDRGNDAAAALLNLALDVLLDGPVAAWAPADAALRGVANADDYHAQAGSIMAPLLIVPKQKKGAAQ